MQRKCTRVHTTSCSWSGPKPRPILTVGRKFEGLRAWFEGGPSHSDDFDSEYPVKIHAKQADMAINLLIPGAWCTEDDTDSDPYTHKAGGKPV